MPAGNSTTTTTTANNNNNNNNNTNRNNRVRLSARSNEEQGAGFRPAERGRQRWRRPRLSWEQLESEARTNPSEFRVGTVKFIKPYGFLVDIGAERLGLVPLREVADHFVRDLSAEAAPGDRVLVRILSVDRDRGRIALSMRDPSRTRERRPTPAEKYASALRTLGEWGTPAWATEPVPCAGLVEAQRPLDQGASPRDTMES